MRISKILKTFTKPSRDGNWSNELFVVDRIQYTDPTTYILKDLKGEIITGAFYEAEIRRSIINE